MAEEKFTEEITFKLIKFLEENPDIIKSKSREVKLNLKEKLKEHLGKC